MTMPKGATRYMENPTFEIEDGSEGGLVLRFRVPGSQFGPVEVELSLPAVSGRGASSFRSSASDGVLRVAADNAAKVDGCPFCDYEGPSEVLFERDGVFFIEPMNPVTEGHVLAIPREHVEDALTSPEVSGRVMEAATWFAVGECNFITSVGPAATQTVRHLHLHIVPRRDGDGLALPWSDRG